MYIHWHYWPLGSLMSLRVQDLYTHLETYSASYNCSETSPFCLQTTNPLIEQTLSLIPNMCQDIPPLLLLIPRAWHSSCRYHFWLLKYGLVFYRLDPETSPKESRCDATAAGYSMYMIQLKTTQEQSIPNSLVKINFLSSFSLEQDQGNGNPLLCNAIFVILFYCSALQSVPAIK